MYQVREDRAGSAIRCKDCGNRIEVPFDDFEDDDYGYEPTRRRSKSTKKKKSSSSNAVPIALVIGGVAVVSVVTIGLLVVLVFVGGDEVEMAQNQGQNAPAPLAIPPQATPSPPPTLNPAERCPVANRGDSTKRSDDASWRIARCDEETRHGHRY